MIMIKPRASSLRLSLALTQGHCPELRPDPRHHLDTEPDTSHHLEEVQRSGSDLNEEGMRGQEGAVQGPSGHHAGGMRGPR